MDQVGKRVHAQVLRFKDFISNVDNVSKFGKVVESSLDLCRLGSHPICQLSRTMRGMLYMPRSYLKAISAAEGKEKGPAIHWVPQGTRLISAGLALLYSVQGVLFFHKQGVIDLGSYVATLSTISSWNGVLTGLIGVPLSFYALGEIEHKLSQPGDQIKDDSGKTQTRDQWNSNWWIHICILGQVGGELTNGLILLNDWKPISYLPEIAAFSSCARGWLTTPTPDPDRS